MLKFPAIGVWKPGQVSISWTRSGRAIVPEVEAIIEQAWQQAMQRPGIHLFDGPMCRVEAFDAQPERIHLTLSRTNYKAFMGTNLGNVHLADQYGRQVLASPVGLSALLLSADGHLMLGRRNARVAYYPSRVHPFAGCLEPGDDVDIFSEVRRELREELALEERDIAEIVCTGIAEDISLRQPELIFAVRATRGRAEIESHLDPTEHHGIWTTPANEPAVDAALRSEDSFTPVGVASIMLWGRTVFGGAWFEKQANYISKR